MVALAKGFGLPLYRLQAEIETKTMHLKIDKNLHTRVHSIIHNSQKMEATQKSVAR